ncbi:MAG: orotidine-5'-phosphate decarboxylase [Planctomycetes bacterium]|nr:orotidine-5'-phosphate decarboxylase [Planctomycetota bacterium]
MTHFADRLADAVRRCANPVVVGIDPRAESLPSGLLADSDREDRTKTAAAYEQFSRGVIDVVAPLVAAVKPQAAFFEQLGPAGMSALGDVIRYARQKGLLVILDGKRNDIGSTATAYARAYLGPESAWQADALTVSPYLGEDSLAPFVDVAIETGAGEAAAGVFVLVKTSNPGGGMFQDRLIDERPLYRHVADYVERLASQTAGECGYGCVGAVVGATYPAQLVELREAMPHTWFLVPGFGSQGATAADVAGAFDSEGLGAIVNSSRGIIFAHRRAPHAEKFGDSRWQEAVEAATREMIGQLRDATPAGKLAGSR